MMLTRRQIVSLGLLAAGLWVAAALFIRLAPGAFTDPALAAIGFVAMAPVGWLSVRLVAVVGRLGADQLVAGVALVGVVAMMIDGAVLRWLPGVYGDAPGAVLAGAAWLLWGYGVSLGVALILAARGRRAPANPSVRRPRAAG